MVDGHREQIDHGAGEGDHPGARRAHRAPRRRPEVYAPMAGVAPDRGEGAEHRACHRRHQPGALRVGDRRGDRRPGEHHDDERKAEHQAP
ncbi:MAG: hypothetical protein ABWY62_00980, partial [Acidimicrobiia bacterium]